MAVISGSGAAAQITGTDGTVVRSTRGYASFPAAARRQAPVIAGGRRVGTIVVKFSSRGIGAIIMQFNAERWRARLLGGSIGALLALAVALLVAPRITAPIERLLQAARAVSSGNRRARAGQVHGFSDLKELAAAFDQMADTLTREEHLRRNMVADISHEPRTPIAVLQAGTEAMLDGVSDLTITQVQSLREEVLRLGRMVDDLQRLASAEAAALLLTLTPCELGPWRPRQPTAWPTSLRPAASAWIVGLPAAQARCDERRMREIVTNLLTNAAKFTPAGGAVVLRTWQDADVATLRVQRHWHRH